MDTETLYISIIDSSEKIPFVLTYGVHKELQEYLLSEDRLFKLYTDTTVSEQVIKLCLSKRNDMGQIVDEFIEVQTVMGPDMTTLLDLVFDYFSEFFLNNQKRMKKLTNSLTQISEPSQDS